MPVPPRGIRSWLTFAEATATLAGHQSVLIALGVHLVRLNHATIGVRIEDEAPLYVVKINRNGTFSLHAAGMRSEHVKAKMSEYSPATVYDPIDIGLDGPEWVITNSCGRTWAAEFIEGMTVDRDGREICRRQNPLTTANAAIA